MSTNEDRLEELEKQRAQQEKVKQWQAIGVIILIFFILVVGI